MKNLGIFLMSLLTFSFASCKEDFKTDVAPQANSPKDPVSVSFTVAGNSNVIDFDQVTESSEIALCTPQFPDNVKASSVLFVISAEGKTVETKTTNACKINSENLAGIVKDIYGVAREERQLKVSVLLKGTIEATPVYVTSNEFTIKVLPATPAYGPFLYYVGTVGWNEKEEGVHQRLALLDVSKGSYAGYIYQIEESYGNTFRFLTQLGAWDYAIGAAEFPTMDGDVEAGSSDNNFAATKGTGVYYAELCIEEGTIKLTKVDYMGISGEFIGWNEGVEMSWNAESFCYEADAAVTSAGWKFRVNGPTDQNWTINLGANDSTEPSAIINDLVQGGKNIGVDGSKVKLYPCRTSNDKIYCTVE